MRTQIRFRSGSTWVFIACLVPALAVGQSARVVRGAAAVEPLENEPSAMIIIDPPLPGPLSHENLHIVPVLGPTTLAVSPRVGHIHVNLDNACRVWADAREEPVILNRLSAGSHKISIQLETATHQRLDQGSVTFTVPETAMTAQSAKDMTGQGEPLARIIVDQPHAEAPSRGVAIIPYHTENLQISEGRTHPCDGR